MLVCKICGSKNGFYAPEEIVAGSVIGTYNSDGTWGDNSVMFDSLITRVGKRAYCVDCDSYVGKTDNLIAGEVAE
ncbi:hypothetical protein ARP93_06750 [Listeria monocytogenes]|nr:hypothetical protein [Listeria monocytogenes]HCJ1285202.1 hypothetical protein [Listeria innocua]EAA0081985.1 hypothetical protein [Listeria monocytogenes]EAC4238345.1 hypothetical protein [Listeria monocytogenes]EAC4241082.1 hypothetical protein [Listeria monocytogenes]